MEFLPEGDRVRIGFYWHALPEADAVDRLAKFLREECRLAYQREFDPVYSGKGVPADAALFAETESRSPMLIEVIKALIGLDSELLSEEPIAVRRLKEAATDPLPPAVRYRLGSFITHDPRQWVMALMTFAPTLAEPYRRVLELRTSVCVEPQLSAQQVRTSTHVDRTRLARLLFVTFMLSGVRTLTPCYASFRADRELLPPGELARSTNVEDFSNLYMGDMIADRSHLARQFAEIPTWRVLSLPSGSFLSKRPLSDEAARDRGIEIIRRYIAAL